MKQYESYMERQEVSASFHEKLLTLERLTVTAHFFVPVYRPVG